MPACIAIHQYNNLKCFMSENLAYFLASTIPVYQSNFLSIFIIPILIYHDTKQKIAPTNKGRNKFL